MPLEIVKLKAGHKVRIGNHQQLMVFEVLDPNSGCTDTATGKVIPSVTCRALESALTDLPVGKKFELSYRLLRDYYARHLLEVLNP